MCGGSTTTPGFVRLDRESVLAGVDVKRSVYDMNESRLADEEEDGEALCGRGDCAWCGEADAEAERGGRGGECGADRAAGIEATAPGWGPSSSEDTTDDVVEKYADDGVMIDGADDSIDCAPATRLPPVACVTCACCG